MFEKGDAKLISNLKVELKNLLDNNYTLNFSQDIMTERIIKVYVFKPKKGQRRNSVSYTINANLLITGVAEDKKEKVKEALGILGTGSGPNKQIAYNKSIEALASAFSKICLWAFPISANVVDIEDNTIYLDRDNKAGLNKGVYCDVLNMNSEKVAVVQILNTTDDFTTAKVVKGGGLIEIGNTVQTRQFLTKYGFGLEYLRVPVLWKPGQIYKEVTGNRVDELSDANAFMVSFVTDFDMHGSQVRLGGGYLKINDMNTVIFDGSVTLARYLIFDELSASISFGGGALFLGSQNYSRPEGDYGDGIDNSGITKSNAQGYFRAEPGITLRLNDSFSILFFAGYFYTGAGDDWQVNMGTSENPDYKNLDSEWLEYKNIQVSGFSFGVKLSFVGFNI